jgi:cytochrome c oxidase subunit 1
VERKHSFNASNVIAIGLVSFFISGGLTGIFLGNSALDIQLHDTYFVVAHFHIVMGSASFFGMLSGIYHWFPKFFGRMMDHRLGQIGTFYSAVMVFSITLFLSLNELYLTLVYGNYYYIDFGR